MTVADILRLPMEAQDVDDATLDQAEFAGGVAERDVARMAIEIRRRRAIDAAADENLDETVRELAAIVTSVDDIDAHLSQADKQNLRAFRDLLSAVLGE